jgi:hypothetical protein
VEAQRAWLAFTCSSASTSASTRIGLTT